MVIPDTFGRRGVRQIVSYDFMDLIEGNGIIEFDGLTTEDSSGLKYALSSGLNYSSVGLTTFSTTAGTRAGTFKTGKFNKPQIIDGSSYVAFTSDNTIKFDIFKENSDTQNTETYTPGAKTTTSADYNFDMTIKSNYGFISELRINSDAGPPANVTITITEGTGTGGTVLTSKNTAFVGWIATTTFTENDWLKLPKKDAIINIRIVPATDSTMVKAAQTYDGDYFSITNQDVPAGSWGRIIFKTRDYTSIIENIQSPSGSSSKVVPIEIPKTSFQIGTKFILRANGNGAATKLTHDPQNKDQGGFTATTNHTTFKYYVPFKINL